MTPEQRTTALEHDDLVLVRRDDLDAALAWIEAEWGSRRDMPQFARLADAVKGEATTGEYRVVDANGDCSIAVARSNADAMRRYCDEEYPADGPHRVEARGPWLPASESADNPEASP